MQENHDWRFFARIFNGRDFLFFQFQALSLLKRSSKYNKWNHDEVALLDHIIKYLIFDPGPGASKTDGTKSVGNFLSAPTQNSSRLASNAGSTG